MKERIPPVSDRSAGSIRFLHGPLPPFPFRRALSRVGRRTSSFHDVARLDGLAFGLAAGRNRRSRRRQRVPVLLWAGLRVLRRQPSLLLRTWAIRVLRQTLPSAITVTGNPDTVTGKPGAW